MKKHVLLVRWGISKLYFQCEKGVCKMHIIYTKGKTMDHKILVKVAFLKVSVNDDYFMTKV